MSEAHCKPCQDRARRGEGPCLQHSPAEQSSKHKRKMRKWRYEGGEPPTVKQMREDICQDEALDAWKDEHVVRPFLARHNIGEGLKFAAPGKRHLRALVAWQIKRGELGKLCGTRCPLKLDREALDLIPVLRTKQIFTKIE